MMKISVEQLGAKKPLTIAAVEHAIAVLRCLSEAREPLGINEIARRVNLHKSSISRLVATLAAARLVERDEATAGISLGTGLALLAAPVLAGMRIDALVRPALLQLAEKSGETSSYNIWDGSVAVTLEQVSGPGAVRIFSEPGRRDPGHCTACGKVLLAHQPVEVTEAYCRSGPLPRYSVRTITANAALKRELALTRERGYGLNFGEFEADVSAASAPVWDARGHVVGSVTLTVPSYRFTPDRQPQFIDMVVATARDLSRNIS